MPETEPSESQPEQPKRRPCLHDPRKFVNCMPVGVAHDGTRPKMRFIPTCPYGAIPGTQYCYPHTILNDAVTLEIADDMLDWTERVINYFASGLLYPGSPLPSGVLIYPGWWGSRFN